MKRVIPYGYRDQDAGINRFASEQTGVGIETSHTTLNKGVIGAGAFAVGFWVGVAEVSLGNQLEAAVIGGIGVVAMAAGFLSEAHSA